MNILKPYSFDDLAQIIDNVVFDNQEQFHGACPACEANSSDGHHLYVKDPGDDKAPLLWCVKCQAPYEELLAALDDEDYDPSVTKRAPPKPSYLKKVSHRGKHGEEEFSYVDTRIKIENYDHEYHNLDGSICYYKRRTKLNDGSKKFSFHYTNEDGQEVWSKPPDAPLLYNLDKMNDAKGDTPLYIVEGEKCADAMTNHSFLATTSNTGAKSEIDFTEVDVSMLGKFPLKIIIPDNDAKGEEYIQAWGDDVKVLNLKEIWPECPHKGDIADYFDAGLPAEAIAQYEFLEDDADAFWEDDLSDAPEFADAEDSLLSSVADTTSANTFDVADAKDDGYTQFPGQKFALRAGSYITGPFGIKKNIIKGKEVTPVNVSPIPILVTAELADQETGEEKCEISFFKRNAWRSITVNRGIIANKHAIVALADIGLEVTSDTAKFLVEYLSFLRNANTDIIPQKPTISRLGWLNIEDKTAFVPFDKEYTVHATPAQNAILSCITSHGSEEEWFSRIKEERTNKYLRIAMAAAFAAPILDIVSANCFIVHFHAPTGTGKTILAMVGASIYGNPDSGKLVFSLNTTVNGINAIATFLHNLPFFGNELQALKNNMANQVKQIGFNFDQFIYDLCEGIDRLRANKSGGAKNAKNWKTVFVFNGEEPIIKSSSGGGAVNRVIEINAKEDLINNIKDPGVGRNLANFLRNNYGFAAKPFINRVIACEDLQERLDAYASELVELAASTPKQIESAAVLLLADSIASPMFGEEIPLTANDIVPFLKGQETVSDADRAWGNLVALLHEKANHFYGELNGLEGQTIPMGDIWGNWNHSTSKVELNKKVLERELTRMGFDFNALKKDWKEKGHILKPEKGWGRQTTLDTTPAYLVTLQL